MSTTIRTPPSKRVCKRHVIFDFDCTVIDTDCELFVFEKLNPDLTEKLNQLQQQGTVWTDAVQQLLNELLETRSISEIEACLLQVPLAPEMVTIFEKLNEPYFPSWSSSFPRGESTVPGDGDDDGSGGAVVMGRYDGTVSPINTPIIGTPLRCKSFHNEVSIVSDANRFFIETVLKHYGVRHCVHAIYTNATHVKHGNNRIKFTHFCDRIHEQHHCATCPNNLCKGEVVSRLMKAEYDHLGRGIQHAHNHGDDDDDDGVNHVHHAHHDQGEATEQKEEKQVRDRADDGDGDCNCDENESSTHYDYEEEDALIPYDNKPSSAIVYVGDGINDFCGARQLSSDDLLFARRGYKLEKYIAESSEQLKCQVEYWSDWKELLHLFLKHDIIME